MTHRSLVYLTFLHCIALSISAFASAVLHAQNAELKAPNAVVAAATDFAIQGEYEGASLGLQVIARGDSDFELVLYSGGLPGAGWDKSPPTRVEGDDDTVQQVVASKKLTKVERKSPTLGSAPPANAIVLFDGTPESLKNNWIGGAKISQDGLLQQGATTTRAFRDYSLHLEFRTPFEPTKEGQGRGNSGVYHQGRYETQVLDSFGLDGKNNEAGGIYSIRDPDLNMCFPPMTWQTYDIDFTAARFDNSGKKTEDARLTVRLNGVVVQQDVSLPHATTAAPNKEGPSDGQIHLQDHGNEVRYRNIWLTLRDPAREARRPRIVGFDRFLVGNENGGRVLISQLGCVACHASSNSDVAPKSAPNLDSVGTRLRFDHFVDFVGSPRKEKSGTTMPDVMHGLSDEQKIEKGKAIASFLAKTGRAVDRPGDLTSANRGEELFHSIGCVACHSPRSGAVQLEGTSVPLGDLTMKYTLDGLSQFLLNPHAIRKSGLMPKLVNNQTEARDIACYLLGPKIIVPSSEQWSAKVFYGEWEKLPDFSKLKEVKAITTTGLDLTAAERTSNFAMQFHAFLPIETAGEYHFYLSSDDGSRLLIDDKVIVDNDGVHPASFKGKKTQLDAGTHRIQVDYFEKGGEEVLALEIEGPGTGRSPSNSWITLDPKGGLQKQLIPSRYQSDEKLVDTGRELFTTSGCANCHALQVNGAMISSRLTAKPLEQLDTAKGCLADDVPNTAPQYDLTAVQKQSIVKALKTIGSPISTEEQVHLQMANSNCYACHTRGNVGGPESTRNSFFKTSMQEMGNEGRLPPSLTGVGDKLRPEVIDSIIAQGAKDRPYVVTRMPGYGAHLNKELRDNFVLLDEKNRGPSTVPARDSEQGNAHLVAGRKLVGGDGLSCIKCHRFGDKATPGIAAIDMLSMPKRLREDWFHRYMLAPTEYRPGTRMPLSFPDGVSTLTTIYGGDAHKQIDAIWLYLSQGKDAKLPSGLDAEAIVLTPSDRPIIYRNFIEGLSPRGIGVGYPEKLNIAWDANQMSLRKIWKNEFIDASKHWVGRGPGFQSPLGDSIVELDKGVPVYQLLNSDEAWPTKSARELGYRFHGFALNEIGQPVFKYGTDSFEVLDFPKPISLTNDAATLERQISVKLTKPTKGLILRLATGSIRKLEDGSFLVDNVIYLSVRGAVPELIQLGDHQEIRCRLPEVGEVTTSTSMRW